MTDEYGKLLDELAAVFAQAAVDAYLRELEQPRLQMKTPPDHDSEGADHHQQHDVHHMENTSDAITPTGAIKN